MLVIIKSLTKDVVVEHHTLNGLRRDSLTMEEEKST